MPSCDVSRAGSSRWRAVVGNASVALVSLVVVISTVGYVFVDPSPSLAFAVSSGPSQSGPVVLYGKVTKADGTAMGAVVTAQCRRAGESTGHSMSDDEKASSGGARLTRSGDAGDRDEKWSQSVACGRALTVDGVWRMDVPSCSRATCQVTLTVQTKSPRASGSKVVTVRPGTTTRVDVVVKFKHHPLISWFPGASY